MISVAVDSATFACVGACIGLMNVCESERIRFIST